MANKLLKKIEITGTIRLLTGLHIGGTNSSMSIGGIDKAVIRNPITKQPFIPGSSLKGKMRSLLEVATPDVVLEPSAGLDNGPSKKGRAAALFGNATGEKTQKPSRLIVRDCVLTNAEEVKQKTELPFTEGKTEVVIDRITSAATPRQIERVPAGAEFSLNLTVNIWEQDANENELMESLFQSLQLLKDDYLGGNGSRGYGQVEFRIADVLEKTITDFYGGIATTGKSVKENYRQFIEKLHQ